MIRYVSGRLAQSLLVMFLVAAVAFALFGFVGDPIRQMITEDGDDPYVVTVEERGQPRPANAEERLERIPAVTV